MKLSVITTVYNAEPYLRESLDSLFSQSFQDFELILVNDGSTDGSKDILSHYSKDRDNVVLLDNKNNYGIPLSRNRALMSAKGEFVAIHDGDDISLPDRFEKEVEYLETHAEVGFLGSHAHKINSSGSLIGYMSYPPLATESAFLMIKRYKLNPVIDPSCMYRRDLVVKLGGYSMDPFLRTALDLHLWCRLLLNGCKLYNFQEPLIKYRINPQGVTRTENDKMVAATDAIVAAFIRKNFNSMELGASFFEQDCFSKIKKI